MELYMLHPVEYEKLYNCSVYNIEEIPLEKRTNKLLGACFIVLFFVFETLYIPCIFAIRKHINQPCYKFMFAIGITDVICLCINGLLTGYFAMTGAVFCSCPNLIYIAGCFGMALWVMESVSAILLAINRCIEISAPKLGARLYDGHRTWLWISIPLLYSTYFFVFTKPVLFSGLFLSWFFNPHVGYLDDFGTIYHSIHHFVHNITVLIGLIGLYAVFVIVFTFKTSSYGKSSAYQSQSKSKKIFQKASFIQVFVISFVNASAAGIYVYMQFFRISDVIIVLGQLFWICAHGIPSVIYLAMNKTIRKECLRMIQKPLNLLGANLINLNFASSQVNPTSMTDARQSRTAKASQGMKENGERKLENVAVKVLEAVS
ncbi:serpentine type 7TM GPCR chemoreceptor srt domain-containing protein [Ditylenchus destructor]|uniref:Serpentine type 7TM GPCR chemoreceptor srt domain-containing protein n=1 Tax=Ditylenchus destructor TaxID=166010 RepID=A0AAD4MHY3_9BILA|nr:serpentine type 7TM GPCR chemoreceptor srt domain-containing protein [Ditylenchus destructor]